jgi:ribosomal protein L40E|tara:strand:- start:7366 stop:7704 length:339 start_codon:yes stop_codon:yes gene_type:complete
MGKIHGVAYLGIGFFIAFVSWIFDFSKLWFFFIIGVLMALYGLVRVVMDIHAFHKVRRNPHHPVSPAHHAAYQHQQQQLNEVKHCKQCGAPTHHGAQFCHSCGHTNFHVQGG